MARTERSRLYTVYDIITTGMDEMTEVLDVGVRRGSTVTHPSRLVEIFEVSTTKLFSHFCAS